MNSIVKQTLPFLLAEAVVFCDVLSSLNGYVYDVAELVEEAALADAPCPCAVEQVNLIEVIVLAIRNDNVPVKLFLCAVHVYAPAFALRALHDCFCVNALVHIGFCLCKP